MKKERLNLGLHEMVLSGEMQETVKMTINGLHVQGEMHCFPIKK